MTRWSSHGAPAAGIALAASALGAVTARVLLDGANDPVPAALAALRAHADPSPPAVTAPPRRHAVIALLDGLGAATFDRLLARGALGPDVAWQARVDVGTPSLSRPVYHGLLTGVGQGAAGVGNNAHHGRARVDTLADRVRAAGGAVAWSLTGVPWFHDLAGDPLDTVAWGPDAPAGLVRALRTGATLTVLHVTAVDHAGHAHGAASTEYSTAARDAFALVRRLRETTRALPDGDRTVWFVGADHGHRARGGHGGPEADVRYVTWVALWPTPTTAVTVPGTVPLERLAPTFAAAMGVPPPRCALGSALPLPVVGTVPPPAELAARRLATLDALSTGHANARRAGAARTAALLTAVTALAVASGRLRALAVATLVPLAACAAWALTVPVLSLSAIATQGGYVARSLAAMALGAALAAPVARRWGAPVWAMVAVPSLAPALALALTGASPGRWGVGPALALALPSTGMLPAGVALGVAAWAVLRGGLFGRHGADHRRS